MSENDTTDGVVWIKLRQETYVLMKNENELLTAQLAAANAEVERLSAETRAVSSLERDLVAMRDANRRLLDNDDARLKQVDALTASNAELEAEVERLKKESKPVARAALRFFLEMERLAESQPSESQENLERERDLWRGKSHVYSRQLTYAERTATAYEQENAALTVRNAELEAEVSRLKAQVEFRDQQIEEMQDKLFRGNSTRDELETRLAAAEKWLFENQYKVQDQHGAMELAATIRAVLPQPTKGAE